MKIYRIYPNYGKGYQETFYATTLEAMFEWLDGLVYDTKISQILVIEHDSDIDCDNPIYLYNGFVDDYIAFKTSTLSDLKPVQIRDKDNKVLVKKH